MRLAGRRYRMWPSGRVLLRACHGQLQPSGLLRHRNLGAKTITCAEKISHPPFVLLVNLDDTREQIDRPGITALVSDLGGASHLLNHDQQMSIRLLDYFAHCRVRRSDGYACEIGSFEQVCWWVLPDHPDALCQFVDR
jgi:hypothetical protein